MAMTRPPACPPCRAVLSGRRTTTGGCRSDPQGAAAQHRPGGWIRTVAKLQTDLPRSSEGDPPCRLEPVETERQPSVPDPSTHTHERAEITLESRQIGPDLAAVRARLLADEPLGEGDRRLAALALEVLVGRLSRQQVALLRQEGHRERDRLIRLAAARFYARGSLRDRALRLIADAQLYQATAWRHDRAHVLCPPRLRGTPQELLWLSFKACPRFPFGQRTIEELIK